jgi:hypothetical protein
MILEGKGFFIWKIPKCENGDANAIATRAQEAGLSHVLIKIANGIYSYNYDWENNIDYLPPVVDALRARGIQVWGWHYVYGDNPTAEASKAVQRVKQYDLDGYVIDAEGHYKSTAKKSAAKTFMTHLTRGLPNTPIALCSYRFPSYHPQLPWNEFLEKCDINMPQVYWIHAHNPGSQLHHTLREFDQMKYKPPIIPAGAAFREHGWQSNAAEAVEFLQTARALNLKAANFWEWSDCRTVLPPDVWNAIRDFDWEGGIKPPEDISGKYIAALNSKDPNQVINLYTNNAVHVNAARTVSGKAAIKSWYTNLFNQLLPNAKFTLTGFSGTGNSRHFTWTAQSPSGNVQDGNDTFGLSNGKITYHYTHFTVA